MSLLVDARYLGAAGLGRYTREITLRLLQDSRFGPVTLAGDPAEIRRWLTVLDRSPDSIRIAPLPTRPFHPASQVGWLRLSRGGVLDADVAFFPHYDIPLLWRPRSSVVAVHDLTHYRVPQAFPLWKRWLGRRVLGAAVGGATRIVTGSAAARRDLASTFPGSEDRVAVVHHGVDPFFCAGTGPPPPAIAALQPYVLCVGDRKPHKNHRVAVEAVAALRRQGRSRLKLVIAGGGREGSDELGAIIERNRMSDAVSLMGRVSDSDLRDLYRHTEALLFPSLYEGFGLPPLEAMACGAPVIASDRASIPEVVGDAGIIVDASDVEAWAHAAASVLDSTDGSWAMRSRGLDRARTFSWDRAAERTAGVLLSGAGVSPQHLPSPASTGGRVR